MSGFLANFDRRRLRSCCLVLKINLFACQSLLSDKRKASPSLKGSDKAAKKAISLQSFIAWQVFESLNIFKDLRSSLNCSRLDL